MDEDCLVPVFAREVSAPSHWSLSPHVIRPCRNPLFLSFGRFRAVVSCSLL